MDLVGADRTHDAEFEANLKNYNFGIAEQNRQITKDIKADKEKLKTEKETIEGLELSKEIKAGAGQGAELLGATKTFQSIQQLQKAGETVKKVGGSIQQGLEQARQVASETAERVQSANPTTETPPLEENPDTTTTGVNEASAGTEAESDVTTAIREGAEGEEEVSTLSKFGTFGGKAIGGVGALAGMGMAIASDENGGWAKKSTADKIGNVVEIGGAGLDLAGLVLEATPLAPLGLALQGIGTLAQIGSGVESEVSSAVSSSKEQTEATQEEQQAEKDEPAPQQEITGVSSAETGGLAVAREQQN